MNNLKHTPLYPPQCVIFDLLEEDVLAQSVTDPGSPEAFNGEEVDDSENWN